MFKNVQWGKVIQIASIAFIILGGITMWRNHKTTKQYQGGTQSNLQQIKVINAEKKQYTPSQVVKNVDASQPNLLNATHNAYNKLNKSINLAYNNTHTSAQFNQNQGKLKNLVDSNVADTMIGDIKPRKEQGFTKYTPMSAKLIQSHISFGLYSTTARVLPIRVLIEYQTPDYSKKIGKKKVKKYNFKYYTSMNINYMPQNSQNSQFSLLNATNGKNSDYI